MGRNNEDFRNQALYHGTSHPFNVGDVVSPRVSGLSYATTDKERAWSYAIQRADIVGGAPPSNAKVFQVEPLDSEELHHTSSGFGGVEGTAVSSKGFKVTKLVREGTQWATDPKTGREYIDENNYD
jgi:hypothetical protein